MYKIEKTVSMTEPRGRHCKYPFPEMEVGDSFCAAGQKPQGGAVVAARAYGKRHTKTFAVRAYEGGVRIWRTK